MREKSFTDRGYLICGHPFDDEVYRHYDLPQDFGDKRCVQDTVRDVLEKVLYGERVQIQKMRKLEETMTAMLLGSYHRKDMEREEQAREDLYRNRGANESGPSNSPE